MVEIVIYPDLVPFPSVQFTFRVDDKLSCRPSVEGEIEGDVVFCKNVDKLSRGNFGIYKQLLTTIKQHFFRDLDTVSILRFDQFKGKS